MGIASAFILLLVISQILLLKLWVMGLSIQYIKELVRLIRLMATQLLTIHVTSLIRWESTAAFRSSYILHFSDMHVSQGTDVPSASPTTSPTSVSYTIVQQFLFALVPLISCVLFLLRLQLLHLLPSTHSKVCSQTLILSNLCIFLCEIDLICSHTWSSGQGECTNGNNHFFSRLGSLDHFNVTGTSQDLNTAAECE